MSDISVIGLGLMGTALASTLQSSGHKLTVWNRSVEKMQPLLAQGASGASSLTDAVQASQVILICVSDYKLTAELFGSEDVSSHLSGRTVVELSSAAPKETVESEIKN